MGRFANPAGEMNSPTPGKSVGVTIAPEMERSIRALPKVELHRHLSGSMRFTSLLELAKRHGLGLGASTAKELDSLIQSRTAGGTLKDFLKAWRILNRITADAALLDPNIYEQLVYEAVADAYLNENIYYLELRMVPPCLTINHDFHAREFAVALWAIKHGIDKAAKEFPTLVKIILSLPRDFLAKQTEKFLKEYYYILLQSVDAYKDRYLVGFDLAGAESGYPAGFFSEFFEQVKGLGYKVTIHAGEADGPESVRQAVDLLHADRIGHGVAACEDEALMAKLKSLQIPIEICVTSNLVTGAVMPLERHPVRRFFDSGLFLTINADDPTVLSTDLNREFLTLVRMFAFSLDEVRTLAANAIDAAFCSSEEKGQVKRAIHGSQTLARNQQVELVE
jgi:adenosine deaminase